MLRGGLAVSEHLEWQRQTSIRRIQADQDSETPPPLAQSIVAAARYVGAEPSKVEAWWNGRGR